MKMIGRAEGSYDESQEGEWLEDEIDRLTSNQKSNFIWHLINHGEGFEVARDYFNKEYNENFMTSNQSCDECGKTFDVDEEMFEVEGYDGVLCEECAEEVEARQIDDEDEEEEDDDDEE